MPHKPVRDTLMVDDESLTNQIMRQSAHVAATGRITQEGSRAPVLGLRGVDGPGMDAIGAMGSQWGEILSPLQQPTLDPDEMGPSGVITSDGTHSAIPVTAIQCRGTLIVLSLPVTDIQESACYSLKERGQASGCAAPPPRSL